MNKVTEKPSNSYIRIRSTPPPQYKKLIKRKLRAASRLKKMASSLPTTQPHIRLQSHHKQSSKKKASLTHQIKRTKYHFYPIRRLLTSSMLKKWSKNAPINQLNFPFIEFSSPRTMMEAKLKRISLARQNIDAIARLRSLLKTPWAQFDRGF